MQTSADRSETATGASDKAAQETRLWCHGRKNAGEVVMKRGVEWNQVEKWVGQQVESCRGGETDPEHAKPGQA